MLWFIFAFLAALFDSLREVASKRSVRHIDEYTVSWAFRFFALLFLLPLLFFIEIPHIGNSFWIALLIGGCLNTISTLLYMKAFKHSDLSITSPMTAFTPLFLLLTSPIILGEFPGAGGLAGVLLIVAGSYMLNIKERRNGYLEPFRALIREKGPKLMLAVAFIWSITSNIDKIGIKNSSPIFWAMAQTAFLAFSLFPIMLHKSKEYIKQVPINFKYLVPIGLFSALALVFQMTAFSMALVVYVTSIKRTSSLLSVLFGHFIFKEMGVKERLIGAIIMILGVVLIALS